MTPSRAAMRRWGEVRKKRRKPIRAWAILNFGKVSCVHATRRAAIECLKDTGTDNRFLVELVEKKRKGAK